MKSNKNLIHSPSWSALLPELNSPKFNSREFLRFFAGTPIFMGHFLIEGQI